MMKMTKAEFEESMEKVKKSLINHFEEMGFLDGEYAIRILIKEMPVTLGDCDDYVELEEYLEVPNET